VRREAFACSQKKKKIFHHIERLEWHLTTYAMQQHVYNDEE
jgi:hypothetical protein